MPDDKKKYKKVAAARAEHMKKAKSFKTAKEAAAWETKRKALDNALIQTGKKTGDHQTARQSKMLGSKSMHDLDQSTFSNKQARTAYDLSQKKAKGVTKPNWGGSKRGMNW